MAERSEIRAGHRIIQAVGLTIMLSVFCAAGWSQEPVLPKGPEQVARWMVDSVWNQGDFRLADRLFGSSVVLHYRGQSIPLTPESGLRIVSNWRTAFPDFHFTIEDIIVQGNKVVMRIPFTGTHAGRFMGAEPTGKKISVAETLILRIENDRIAEMWEDYDEYGMRIQLGLIKAN